jgi:hypothetical protein
MTLHPFCRTPTLYFVCRGVGYEVSFPRKAPPAMLVSHWYRKDFEATRHTFKFRSWILDSGGFSAHAAGKSVDLDDYLLYCHEKMACEPTLKEIICLDVIGDWRGTKRNVEKMWKAGVPAMPVFHVGEPLDVLKGYADDYPKVCLGGMVPLSVSQRRRFAERCFARVWPKAMHGLGVGGLESMIEFPWHSVDNSSWVGCVRFGHWEAFGNAPLRTRNVGGLSLRAEVEHHMAYERYTWQRWHNEMAQFDHEALLLPLARQEWLRYKQGHDNRNETEPAPAKAGGHGRHRESHTRSSPRARARRQTRSHAEHATARG